MASDCSLDSRGIPRGECTDEKCKCDKYDGGIDGKKCVSCSHPPGKHKNLNKATSEVGQSHSCNGKEEPRNDWPTCIAKDCKNHVEPLYTMNSEAPLQYCSPECRDETLLDIHHSQLESDIRELEVKLKSLTPIFISRHIVPRQPLQPGNISDKNGSSLTPSGVTKNVTNKDAGDPKGGHPIDHSPICGHSRDHSHTEGQFPSRDQSIAHENSKSPTRSSKGKKKNKRKKSSDCDHPYREVNFMKEMNKDCGIIVYDRLWLTNDGVLGLLVTGVEVHSKSFEKMQNCQIQFCDVIIEVNDKLVNEVECVPQEILHKELLGKVNVKLKLYREQYYASDVTSKAISMVKDGASHIIDVLHPKNLYMTNHSEFGISITNKKMKFNEPPNNGHIETREISDNISREYACGMRDGDQFVACVIAYDLPKDITNSLAKREKKFPGRISEASSHGRDVIIAIKR